MRDHSEVVCIPAEYCGHDWRITYPRLKLALKYGLVGPWAPLSWSEEYDAYTTGREPASGLPTLRDFVITRLMNSGVSQQNLKDANGWLAEPAFVRPLEKLGRSLRRYSSLIEAPDQVARQSGDVGRHIWNQDPKRGGVAVAKAFKWLATWAPDHVPMLDSLVWSALDHLRNPDGLPEAVSRFRVLCVANTPRLTRLQVWLNGQLANRRSRAQVSLVRVLDSLIWLDWVLDGKTGKELSRYVRTAPWKAGSCLLTKEGRAASIDLGERAS
jgi:hypothetical protein